MASCYDRNEAFGRAFLELIEHLPVDWHTRHGVVLHRLPEAVADEPPRR